MFSYDNFKDEIKLVKFMIANQSINPTLPNFPTGPNNAQRTSNVQRITIINFFSKKIGTIVILNNNGFCKLFKFPETQKN
jgi:hypothetical protein